MKQTVFIDRQSNLAERELSAFIAAVLKQYGPEQAQISAEDWLEELEQLQPPSPCDIKNWRAITIAASARLAERLSVFNWQHACCERGKLSVQLPGSG